MNFKQLTVCDKTLRFDKKEREERRVQGIPLEVLGWQAGSQHTVLNKGGIRLPKEAYHGVISPIRQLYPEHSS